MLDRSVRSGLGCAAERSKGFASTSSPSKFKCGRLHSNFGNLNGRGAARRLVTTEHIAPISSLEDQPSTSAPNLADFGMRITLERLYHNSTVGSNAPQSFDVWSPGVFLVSLDDKPQRTRNQERTPNFFANVGDAIRTLREDIPLLFYKDLNYDVYTEDMLFKDPRNTFRGLKNYKTIFWSLRFHGRIFFKRLYVDVQRIWQPEDTVIKMRWTVHGVPRVPWEAEGTFDGISTYKLDKNGRIYEHCVDNVLLRDPPMLLNPPFLSALNLMPAPQQQPYPGAGATGIAKASLFYGNGSTTALHIILQHP